MVSILPYYNSPSVLGVGFSAVPDVVKGVTSQISEGDFKQVLTKLQVLNIRYIFIPLDIPEKYSESVRLREILNNADIFSDRTFENFILYTPSRGQFPIHMPFAVPCVNQTIDNEVLILPKYDKDITFSFLKINPSHYVGEVNASKPFLLVFSQQFNSGWMLYADGVKVPENYHLQINGYANAWQVKSIGHIKIEIKFQPQIYLDIGLMITKITIILATLYITMNSLIVKRALTKIYHGDSRYKIAIKNKSKQY